MDVHISTMLNILKLRRVYLYMANVKKQMSDVILSKRVNRQNGGVNRCV